MAKMICFATDPKQISFIVENRKVVKYNWKRSVGVVMIALLLHSKGPIVLRKA